jgi:uncharacterized protein
MRLVLDTNIFISAFLWGGKPKAVLERILEGADTLFISRSILAELNDVLCRPKLALDAERIAYFLQAIEETSTLVAPTKMRHRPSRDPADVKILECAVAAEADYIVTGDDDLLVLDPYRSIRIVSASEYLKQIQEP